MEYKVGIIILNYNDYIMTEENIDKLIELKFEDNIVIVDNNSTNNSFECLSEKYKNYNNIYVIKNLENHGYASGNNFGVKFIIKNLNFIKYICIMNPDVKICYKEIFSNLINKIENRSDIALIGAMMIFNNTLDSKNACWKLPDKKSIITGYSNFLLRFTSCSRTEELIIDKVDLSIVKDYVVQGCFFIIKKEVFEEIGLFDESTFLYNEENILAIKLRNRGYAECISINDYYLHNHKKSANKRNLKDKINTNYFNFQSRKHLCKTYYDKRLVLLLYIVYFLNVLDISIVHLMSMFRKV